MTVEERLDALEASSKKFQELYNHFVNPLTGNLMLLSGLSIDGLVPWVQLNCRVGIMSNFQAVQPFGEGASLSVGTAIDKYAGYFEIDGVVCRTGPSVALFASNVAVNFFGQANHAFEGVVGNSVNSRGLVLTQDNFSMAMRVQGFELITPGIPYIKMGYMNGHIVDLWLPK